MRILMSFGRRASLPALLTMLLAGCYIPGGGWTLRGGADLRTRYKPTVFVEMVDSRWDEYNRVACQNTQCQPRSGGKAGTGTGTATDASGHSGCLLGLPLPGTLTPIPSTGPTLAPGFAPDPNRPPTPNDSGNGSQPNSIPQSPLPQYQFQNPAAPQYPVPQPYPNNVPPDPAEDVPGSAPQNEPNPAPGVTATSQQYPPQYGAWPGSGNGPALMLPAPDPVMPAYGDSGLNSQGPTEPASGTSSNAGLELSSYEQTAARNSSNRFTAGSKIAPNGRAPVRRRYSTDPTDPSGANRHFARPRL